MTMPKDDLHIILDALKTANADLSKQVQELSDYNFQLRNLIDQLPGDIYWKDKDGFWLGMNKHCGESLKKMGFIPNANVKNVIGKTDYDIFSKETADVYRVNDLKAVEQETETSHEEITTLPSGERVTLLSIKKPYYARGNQIAGIIGNTIDITHLKKIEAELKEARLKAEAASQAKDEFIRNMSNDIRTPLSGIIGMSSIIEQEAQNQEEKEHAHMVNVSGEQLLTLLNSVLDIIATGSQKENQVNLSKFKVDELIHNIADLELPTITLKNLELRLNLSEDLPSFIESDQIKIHRILLNILGNAVKFTQQGFIEIGARLISNDHDQPLIEFSIQDSGDGIKPEDLDKVFKKFYRGTPAYEGIYSGHGVGLHIVKQYVQLLEGNVSVESTLGQGTRFIITIPIKIVEAVDVPQVKPQITAANNSSTPVSSSIKILLIEDNAIALKTAENLLKKQGIGFQSAITGEQAITLFKTQAFDLVLSDIGLPDISGLEVARQIRAIEQENKRTPIPIIGLTAHSIIEAEPEGLQAGMDQVMTKPVSPELLKQLLNDHQPKAKKSTPPAVTENSLESHALLDIEAAIETLGSSAVLTELLTMLLKESESDLKAIQLAWDASDFVTVQQLAHKMKSGALYCGTIRMRYACEALENHFKHQQPGDAERLYQDFCEVNQQTLAAIQNRLNLGHNQETRT